MDGNGLTKVKLPLARFCGVKYTKKTTRGQTAEEKIPNSIINDSLENLLWCCIPHGLVKQNCEKVEHNL